mgnify:CR=1 FL=1
MIDIIWEYSVPAENVAEFERHYSSRGTWVGFFLKADEYHGTLLLRDAENPGRYVTIDRWDSFETYQAFCQAHEAEYRRIDALCANLTLNERRIGLFEVV